MARGNKTVTRTQEDKSRLPDWTAEGVALLADLERRGALDDLEKRLRIRREGGYPAIDVFLLLLFMFTSRLNVPLKPFCERVRPWKTKLAALGGRINLPSQSSASRALNAVKVSDVRPLHRWLLIEMVGAESIFRHPSTQTRDANGEGWDLFDYDGTLEALRQRALPDREDLPEGIRRAEELAAAGYPGRKRGDVQVYRATLQHSGSGLWLYAALSPGNGEHRADFEEALDVVVETCNCLGRPIERALVRVDGAYGWVPDFTACRRRGLPFVTRLTRPEVFDQPDVRHRMADAKWVMVPDSGGGPRRSAADLGLLTIHAGDKSIADDGMPYEPIEVRVVVSRFERDEAQRGRVIDGWQYELFVIDAAPDAWPAADVVATYMGRSTQENRFGQEDRELQLDHVFCYTLGGQELATLVGLMVWNLRIARGFELAPPAHEIAAQPPRLDVVDPRPVPPEAPAKDVPPTEVDVKIVENLNQLDWRALLADREGWKWKKDRGEVRCPDNQVLTFSFVNYKRGGTPRLHFSGQGGACDGCPKRLGCFAARNRRAVKMINVGVDRTIADRLDALLAQRAGPGLKAKRRRVPRQVPQRGDMPLRAHELQEQPGTMAVAVALFLPATARRLFAEAATRLTTYVEVVLPPNTPPHPALVARSEAHRGHRRLTWDQHLARYALPAGAAVRVTFAGAPELSDILGSSSSAQAAG